MSDDEKDIDVESEEDEYQYDDLVSTPGLSGLISPGSLALGFGIGGPEQFMTQAEKRAHHNALERKRRDHIKESFHGLRDAVPVVHGEKVSRAQILKKAAEYISFMRRKNTSHQQDIEDIKRQNQQLEHERLALCGETVDSVGSHNSHPLTTVHQVRLLEKTKSASQYSQVSSIEERLSPFGTQSTHVSDDILHTDTQCDFLNS